MKTKAKKIIPYFGFRSYEGNILTIGQAKFYIEGRNKKTIGHVNGKRYTLKELYQAIP